MKNNTIEFLVNNEDAEKRLDICLSNHISHLTRSSLKKAIEKRKVAINGEIVNLPSKKVKFRQSIKFYLENEVPIKIKPSKIKLNIIFEDKDILIIDKPKGMVVHPGAGNYENTLANALVYKYKNNLSSLSGELRPGIVHRIDKETSGLLIVAKNNLAHSNLSKQFSNHTIKRKYQCLIWGIIRPLEGRIETLISRSKKNRQLMTVSEIKGKKAITNYKTIKTFNVKNIPKISLIECELETGRTHQIRVHLKYKKTSILGDNQYGVKKLKFKKINEVFFKNLNDIKGQALHAQTLGFVHPTKKKWIEFKTNMPADFKNMLNLLNKLCS